MNTFDKELIDAKKAEDMFLHILCMAGSNAELNQSSDINQLRKGDIVVHDDRYGDYYLEVKHDKMASTTGNVCFELSTLNHTASPYLVYLIDDNFYIWKTNDIKRKIINKEYKARVKGGDNNHALYLFDKDSITSSASAIYNSNEKNN
jgi:hypothetical protein